MFQTSVVPPYICFESLESRRLFASRLPAFDHIVIVVEENKDYADIVSNSDATFIRALARHGSSLPHAHAVAPGSIPNYIAMFSGSTQGVGANDTVSDQFDAPSLGGQLLATGRSFAGYSEDLPQTGYTGQESGGYVRRHNPWVDFSDVPASVNRPFSRFPTDASGFAHLPTVSFVIPNLQHDMHDGSILEGDRWLRAHLGDYANWALYHNSLLIVTWDEGATETNHIPTIFYGAQVRKGHPQLAENHYRLLRTIEGIFHFPPLGHAADEAPLYRVFQSPTTTAAAPLPTNFSTQPISASFSLSPVPGGEGRGEGFDALEKEMR